MAVDKLGTNERKAGLVQMQQMLRNTNRSNNKKYDEYSKMFAVECKYYFLKKDSRIKMEEKPNSAQCVTSDSRSARTLSMNPESTSKIDTKNKNELKIDEF